MTTVRTRLAVALVGAALALTSCGSSGSAVSPLGGGSGGPTAPAGGGATQQASPPSSASASGTAGVQLAGFTPRSITYRQFDVTLEQVEIAQVTPDTFGVDGQTPAPADHPYAYVQVKVKNRLNFATAFIAPDEVFLAPASGDPIAMESAVGKSTDIVENGATNEGWFAFPLQAGTDLTGASLVFGSPGQQRETMPLTGQPPAPAWPRKIVVPSPGVVRVQADHPYTVRITITSAELSDATAFDLAGHSYASKQALTGRRKLYLAFTATLLTYGQPNDNSEVLPFDVSRLVVDGDRTSDPAEVSDSTILTKGTPYHGVYVWDVPTTGTVQLEWGEITQKPVRVTVPVS